MGAAAVDNPTACGDRKPHRKVAGKTVSTEREERVKSTKSRERESTERVERGDHTPPSLSDYSA
jgi:hypothetical protein